MGLPTKLSFVTVMDVEVFDTTDATSGIGTIECLTISNITQEGPRKEIRGGRNAEPCIRYGKTMRLEMEDAVMRKEMVNTLFGADIEVGSISFTETFPKGIKLIGTTQVVDTDTGVPVEVKLTIHRFIPDGVTDLTMESEGDIGVISIAGELFSNEDGEFFDIELA